MRVTALDRDPEKVTAHGETDAALHALNNYTSALVSHDFKAAYSMCARDFDSAMPYDEFVRFQSNLEAENGSIVSAKEGLYNVAHRGSPLRWNATIDASLQYQRATLEFEFGLRKEGGRWVIYGIKQR